ASKDTSGDTCVICLSTITDRAITAPCNHYTFDFICLVSWLQQRSTCPLCKAQISSVQYDFASPTNFKTHTIHRTHLPSHSDPSRHPFSLHAPYGLPHRPRRPTRAPEHTVLDTSLLRRRHIYRHNLYSHHVGSNPSSRSRYRDITPCLIAASPALQSKARTFLRRELRVFTFLYNNTSEPLSSSAPSAAATTSSNAEFLLAYIVAMLKKVDIKGSDGRAEDIVGEFLGRRNARLLLHELGAWMRSPFEKLRDWDREVQY
ncbi:hypothetical protein CC80DRAFT_369854, partial [Byssothecium circinans]